MRPRIKGIDHELNYARVVFEDGRVENCPLDMVMDLCPDICMMFYHTARGHGTSLENVDRRWRKYANMYRKYAIPVGYTAKQFHTMWERYTKSPFRGKEEVRKLNITFSEVEDDDTHASMPSLISKQESLDSEDLEPENMEFTEEEEKTVPESVRFIRTTKTGDEDFAFMDSGSDTSGLGGEAWNITHITKRKVRVTGFENEKTAKNNVPIGTGITAVDLPNDTTVILRVNEATLLGENANTLLSPTQIRENGHIIDEQARKHGGKGCITADGYVIPMTLREGMMAIKIRQPTS